MNQIASQCYLYKLNSEINSSVIRYSTTQQATSSMKSIILIFAMLCIGTNQSSDEIPGFVKLGGFSELAISAFLIET